MKKLNLDNYLQHKMNTDPMFFLTCGGNITKVRDALTSLMTVLNMTSEERKFAVMLGDNNPMLLHSNDDIADVLFGIWKQVN